MPKMDETLYKLTLIYDGSSSQRKKNVQGSNQKKDTSKKIKEVHSNY